MSEMERALNSELLPDETVLWTGQPNLKKLFTRTDIYLAPFSIFWCSIPVYAIVSMLSSGTLFGLVIALPFSAIGLYLVFGRFIVKARIKKRTVYAITDRRVMALTLGSTGEKKRSVSHDIANIKSESVTMGRSGCGNLYFGDAFYYSRVYLNTGLDFMSSLNRQDAAAFVDVDDVERVYGIYSNVKYGGHN